jgi:hypothetical protein
MEKEKTHPSQGKRRSPEHLHGEAQNEVEWAVSLASTLID